MPHEKLKPKLTLDTSAFEEMKRVVPEAFADGKINWETLKEALGEHLEEESGDAEHFGLFWHGKRDARRMAAIPSKGTLVPMPGEGIDEETTRNIFIEGENLEVLKLLQKSYAGKIKMIYIDPPYNTGKDFVYEDDFREPLEEYLRRTGQVDEEGKPFTTNTRADGRFHSKWLSMMYPRLKLARNLLKDDGVIFISIDDTEDANLRSIMNEIFGEENYITTVIWQKKYSPQNDAKYFSDSHDYIQCYSKNKDGFNIGLLPRTEEANDRYKNPDNDPRGPWKSSDLTRQEYRPNDDYEITSPTTGRKFSPPKGNSWGRPKEKVEELIGDNRIWFGSDGNSIPSLKRFLSEVKQGITPQTIWFRTDVGDSQEGKKQIKDIFGNVSIFETPKPIRLIQKMMEVANIQNESTEIILDFFAGSGTTAHAILEKNNGSQDHRKFVLVQIPEHTDEGSEPYKAGFLTIADICKERIRRVSKKLKQEKVTGDLGFKAFKLTNSNYKIWQDYNGTNITELEEKLELFETPFVDGWKPEKLLTEILLMEGFPLDSKIEKLNAYKKNTINRVSSDFCEHHLVVCLDQKLKDETIEVLTFEENDVFICLDSALTDQSKLRLADVCKLKTI